MTRNPILNALTALGYIILIASIMFFGLARAEHEDTIIIPITILSLFTLSAAIMGFIFLSQPLQLYIDGKKKEAVNLFIHTLIIFAGITAIAIILLLSGLVKPY